VLLSTPLHSVVVVISQHLLNVFVQLANKRRFKKKRKKNTVNNYENVYDWVGKE
jgi:hypothetical protein